MRNGADTGTGRPAIALFCVKEVRGSAGCCAQFALLRPGPRCTKAQLRHAQDWLGSQVRQLMIAVALILGATWLSAAWSA